MNVRPERVIRRLVGACLVASVVASAVVVLRAAGDYNSNPPYCRSHGVFEPPFLWAYYECWKPDPPDWAYAG